MCKGSALGCWFAADKEGMRQHQATCHLYKLDKRVRQTERREKEKRKRSEATLMAAATQLEQKVETFQRETMERLDRLAQRQQLILDALTLVGSRQQIAEEVLRSTRTMEVRSKSIPLEIVGSLGHLNGHFKNPYSVATFEQGSFVISDCNNHRLQVFGRPKGTSICHLLSLGSKGSHNGQFHGPRGLAIDSSGNILVCDSGNHRVQMFDDRGVHVLTIGSEGVADGLFKKPHGVAFDHVRKRIVVSDRDNHRIQIFDRNGSHLRSFGSFGSSTRRLNCPDGIAIDQRNGDIVVSDTKNNRIQVYDSNGNHVRQISQPGALTGHLLNPHGVAVDLFGNVFVCDTENRRVQVFDPFGVFIHSFGAQPSHASKPFDPVGIAVGPRGGLFVVEWDNHRVQLF